MTGVIQTSHHLIHIINICFLQRFGPSTGLEASTLQHLHAAAGADATRCNDHWLVVSLLAPLCSALPPPAVAPCSPCKTSSNSSRWDRSRQEDKKKCSAISLIIQKFKLTLSLKREIKQELLVVRGPDRGRQEPTEPVVELSIGAPHQQSLICLLTHRACTRMRAPGEQLSLQISCRQLTVKCHSAYLQTSQSVTDSVMS